MEYDFSRRMRDFNMTNPVVVSSTGKGEPIVAYTNEYNGREYAHIRALYQGHNDVWCPGKQGISFPVEEMTDVLLKIAERFVVEAAPAKQGWTEQDDQDRADAGHNHEFNVGGAINKGARTVEAEAFPNWTTDELRKGVTKSGTSSVELKRRMQVELDRREAHTMPKMSNGLAGLARLKSSMGGTNGNGGPTITDKEWQEFLYIAGALSPENLTCDGELSKAQVLKKSRQLHAQWENLEKRVGRKVSEDEAYAWDRKRYEAKKAVPARFKSERRRSK